MKHRIQNHYPPEQQFAIALEYIKSKKSYAAIGRKYGISNVAVYYWVKKYGLHEKYVSLGQTIQKNLSEMPTKGVTKTIRPKTQSELEEENIRLQMQLKQAQQQILALNTMIDIAEEQGMTVRKKSGAKQ